MYSYVEKEARIDITERLLNALKLIDETQRLRSIGFNGGVLNINTDFIIATKDYAIHLLKASFIDYLMILALQSDEDKDGIYISKDAIKDINRRLQLLRIGENNGIKE